MVFSNNGLRFTFAILTSLCFSTAQAAAGCVADSAGCVGMSPSFTLSSSVNQAAIQVSTPAAKFPESLATGFRAGVVVSPHDADMAGRPNLDRFSVKKEAQFIRRIQL